MKRTRIILFAFLLLSTTTYAQETLSLEELYYYPGLQIFPNPAEEKTYVYYGYTDDNGQLWLDFEESGSVNIFAMDGTIVRSDIPLDPESSSIQIPLAGIGRGLYIFTVTLDDKDPEIFKVVKE